MPANVSMFTSHVKDYETPSELFIPLDKIFHFKVDVCASPENTQCLQYFSEEMHTDYRPYICLAADGLAVDWNKYEGPFWMNPPYGSPEKACKPGCQLARCESRGGHLEKDFPGIIAWVRKAYDESAQGATVVGLLPYRPDTLWWNTYVAYAVARKRAQVYAHLGRIKFGGASNPAGFPSALVVWRPELPYEWVPT